jgi:tricorn protease
MRRVRSLCALVALLVVVPLAGASTPPGYYRQPAIAHDTIVFVSEGDLWTVPVAGGAARRLTSHPAEESMPALSPDGQTVAFVANYEGPAEVYTMPLAGGRPERRTYDGGSAITFVGWTHDGKVLYGTNRYATLPNAQLVTIDLSRKDLAGQRTVLPLAQAADGCYDASGSTLYFTRLPFQGSHTSRYQGGTAQNLWRFAADAKEAQPLTADFPGTSKRPLWWQGRVYFTSDRDGTLNVWSMRADGADLKQHTHHNGWDVLSPSLGQGRIVYQLGADLRLYDIAADQDRAVPVTTESDFDQMREHWVKKPMEYLTSVHLAPDGGHVVLTARGRVFVAPHRQGRLVEVTRKEGVRYRDARFLPDGKTLVALSDESGEVEVWKLPANGVGTGEQLTTGGDILRWEAIPSPDGKRIAHRDKNQRLFILDLATKTDRKIDESKIDDITGLRWSPDSKWLAYVAAADNLFRQIKLYGTADGKITALTSDRYESSSPAWSPDGKWLYLLSDRNLKSLVESPWGSYQPDPFLDKKTKLYQIALTEGQRSPFAPADELHPDKKEEPKKEPAKSATPEVKIDLAGIQARLLEVPVPAGNYSSLSVNDKALFWLSRATDAARPRSPADPGNETLQSLAITRESPEVKTVVDKIRDYELSQDGKKILVRKGQTLAIIDANPAPADLAKKDVDLSKWMLSVLPREEWRQMFIEAWRLERDYFYDRNMHGVDWKATRAKYAPLVERVRDRSELSDLVAQMVGELSALHIFVRGGDVRAGDDKIEVASLGAVWTRDEAGGGMRVAHVYRSDPDRPELTSPLHRPGVGVKEGDVVEMIDGTRTLAVADAGMLLRQKAGQQVLLHVKPAGGGVGRDVIVTPIGMTEDADLRYHEWEYTRRLEVDELGHGELGYVHLRAMGGGNFTEWARDFYPVFQRKGLVIDVRHNRGGNIDSWILSKLLRKAWFYWSQRVGRPPTWNMQYAFRGHIVVLCDEFTASDGEAFTEGIKRLGLGKVIGTRTWGGEIWLSSSNFLVDRGIATAAEMGVYGPEGAWLIEGHGVDPDMVVDNLPHATFAGQDAQLQAAIALLQKQIKEQPVEPPAVPPYPNKALKPKPPAR